MSPNNKGEVIITVIVIIRVPPTSRAGGVTIRAISRAGSIIIRAISRADRA